MAKMFMMSTGGTAVEVSRMARSIVGGTFGAHPAIFQIAALPEDQNFERALVNWCKRQTFMRLTWYKDFSNYSSSETQLLLLFCFVSCSILIEDLLPYEGLLEGV